jgi:short subunit dehydrogenase-like uncharacterized protein
VDLDADDGLRVLTIGVFGASGFTGRLVADEVRVRGHRLVAIDRDAGRVHAAVAAEADGSERTADVPVEVRVADAHDDDALCRALDGVDVVVGAVGPYDRLGRGLVDAAIATGTHYVDVAGEQPFLRWLHAERQHAATTAGVTIVPAVGLEFLPGDLLASVGAAAAGDVDEIHVAYGVGRTRGRASRGTRATLGSLVGVPVLALHDGRQVEERLAASRRLAWFPRPVGPRHAAGVPGGEVLSVPRHVPGVRTVATYLAIGSMRAELLQFSAGVARWEPARRRLAAMVAAGGGDVPPGVRAGTRWGVVAEVVASSTGPDKRPIRAWAAGSDPYGFAAVGAVLCGERVVEASPGVRAPAEIAPAADLLDALAARARIRWGIVRPGAASTR